MIISLKITSIKSNGEKKERTGLLDIERPIKCVNILYVSDHDNPLDI